MPDEVAPGRWLLQPVGAVALRNSIYVLPNNAEAREDFEGGR
jgi:hypothetical protein